MNTTRLSLTSSLDSAAIALHHLCPSDSDRHLLSDHILQAPRDSPGLLTSFPFRSSSSHMGEPSLHQLRGSELSFACNFMKPLHLRSLYQARAPIGHLRPVRPRLIPRLSRFILSHGGDDIREPDSRKLDYRMRGWVARNCIDVRYTVCMDFVVDLHSGNWIHEGHCRGRTNEE